MGIKFSNNAITALSASLASGATTATVSDGSVFPALGGSDYCYLTINGSSGTEIVKCTAISINTLTIVRAQDGTSALSFIGGDKIELRLTTAALNDLAQETDSLAELSGDLDDITDGTTYAKMTSAQSTKLDGIETAATADQTGAEIKSAYEAEAGTNAFTDADHSKLDGIAASANNYTHPTGAGNEHLPSAVSQTEAGYLDGVTSAIQTQIDGKQASSDSDFNISLL